MKKLNILNLNPLTLVMVVILAPALFGCLGGENYDIESSKVSSPEEVSNKCSQNLGIPPNKREQMVSALKENGSKLNDKFKLDVYIVISETDEIPPQEKENVLKSYFTCIKNTIGTEESK